jgi:hypothetical protein
MAAKNQNQRRTRKERELKDIEKEESHQIKI